MISFVVDVFAPVFQAACLFQTAKQVLSICRGEVIVIHRRIAPQIIAVFAATCG
ncbi:hypothetical protein [Stenoxybacter acetivorans]|uniref:hypothetical protein n=1 Tax=Stenoxybacter acetivorans TaxID=422441 RepID=UPI0012EBFDF5|nr:hypothetical protein [Stenoxybacter acetivorans]